MALRPISRLEEYEFPEGTWDIRGWTVRTESDEKKVGKVDDVLLDGHGKLRYLDVDLGFMKKHVLVPLERGHADPENKVVWTDLTRDRLEEVPEYALDPETLDEDYERRLDAVYGGTRALSEGRLVAPEEDGDGELDLQRMSSIEDEYQVAGEDPRGWKVITGDGHTIGRVVELLMEPSQMKARFLDVAVDEKKLELEPVDRHILLPSSRVRLDRKKKTVLVGGLLAGDLAEYPQYGGLPIHRGTSRELDTIFERVATADPDGDARSFDRQPPDWHDRTLQHFYRPGPRARRRVREED